MPHPDEPAPLDAPRDAPRDAEDLWEARYASSRRIWSGRPNDALVLVVEGPALAGTAPGTALDLGCGEGADAVWLASRGWRVTGVDVSGTALARAREHAADAGVGDRTTFARHDLGADFPAGTFDLVAASFLHSTAFLDRVAVLRSAAAAVAAGGSLLVVGHADLPPWADLPAGTDPGLPSPAQVLADLALAPGTFEVLRSDLLPRTATRPPGAGPDPAGDAAQPVVLHDGVLHLRRVA